MEAAGQPDGERESGTGFPELTALGKRIEMLRIERGLSKQLLARGAGTSRQQLWRVMTGKSELTMTLGHRLADVLQVDLRRLRDGDGMPVGGWSAVSTSGGAVQVTVSADTLAVFLADPAHLERAIGHLPGDAHGRRLKLALLDALEAEANGAGLALSASHAEIRTRVVAG